METPEQIAIHILKTEPSDTEAERIALAKKIDDAVSGIPDIDKLDPEEVI